jgi:acyl-CoA synthetase (AMP-forming)/AMP-acid ligase II
MLAPHAAVRLNATRRGSAPALVTPERVITHTALAERMTRLAAGLRELAGDNPRVGALLGNVPEHLEMLFAVSAMGGCAVPMDPRWSARELAAALTSFEPGVVLVEPALHDLLRAACEDAGVAPRIVPLGEAYEALCSARPGVPADDDLGRDYLVAPTGGTTSGLKGTRISYRATIMRFLIQAAEFGFNADDVYLAATPLFHGGARSFAMGHVYYGGAVVLAGRIAADQVPALVSRHGVTLTFLVPTTLRDLTALGSPLGGRLRALIASGSKLDADLRSALHERVTPHVYNYFASVEAGGISVSRPTDPSSKLESVGRPVWATEVRMLDAHGAPVQPGEIGRVAVTSLATSSGYVNDAQAERAFYQDGAVLTGDVGWLDEDGYLSLAGRETDMIISGGINVQPAEVEAVLAGHPAVASVAVLGVADPRWGEAVTAVVVRQRGAALSADELVAYAGQRLAAYKRPKRVVFRDSLPLSSMGKVAKQVLRTELERDGLP